MSEAEFSFFSFHASSRPCFGTRSAATALPSVTKEDCRLLVWASSPTSARPTMTAGPTAPSSSTTASEWISFLGRGGDSLCSPQCQVPALENLFIPVSFSSSEKTNQTKQDFLSKEDLFSLSLLLFLNLLSDALNKYTRFDPKASEPAKNFSPVSASFETRLKIGR